MLALVGLGNPTEEYAKNRHNVGFMFVDFVARKLVDQHTWTYDKYLHADILSISPDLSTTAYRLPSRLILLKPQTYMNRSGDSVKKMFMHYKLQPANFVVIHDDLDIAYGKCKVSRGVGPKLHNGIESIEHALQTSDFLRLRIGVDNRSPDRRIPGEAYVLQNFTPEEYIGLDAIFENGIIALWQQLMNS